MNVAVFGASQPKEGEPVYEGARQLGRLLAQAGYDVWTGGYMGVMEAVSRGAWEAGGHVVGVTCAEIERWRPIGANRWVKEERRCSTLLERLRLLTTESAAALAFPGGSGTLTEVALFWNLMIIQATPLRPLILIGHGWETVMETFFRTFEIYVSHAQRRMVSLVPDVRLAFERLLYVLQ